MPTDMRGRSTDSIDVSALVDELDITGSFYFDGVQTTSFGQLLEALPVPCLLIDKSGTVVFANESWERVSSDYKKILNMPFASLVPDSKMRRQAKIIIKDVFDTRKPLSFKGVMDVQGTRIFGQVHFRSVRMGNKRLLLTLVEDTTAERQQLLSTRKREKELREARDQIKQRLQEKELLLREIHHRVKNNLQLMSSLLSLQASHVADRSEVKILKDAESRIWSMALVHESLYRTGDFSRIGAREYFEGLAGQLMVAQGSRMLNIELKTDIQDLQLNTDVAINCGLIVTELVTNSIKHAFRETQEGEISVSFHSADDDGAELKISDNGIGMHRGDDSENASSFGLELVKMLVDELRGTIELSHEQGSNYRIRFRQT